MSEAENAAATEFSHAEWSNANVDKYNNADKSRSIFRLNRDYIIIKKIMLG